MSYPWMTYNPVFGNVEIDLEDCTPDEMNRRMVIMQEVASGRLLLPDEDSE